ncbi:MAG: DNA polymerase III subunit delta' [Granulosicoccus sp.]
MEALTPCPPWLYPDANALLAAADNRRLHHALLISGIDGIGKRQFCQWLAEALLCRERSERGACGECASCKQLLADAHPDYLPVYPEGANAGIKIDTVRELVEWMQLTAGQKSYRVALITEANGLNRHSANSLLKTLEEPADNALLILCATRIGALPATVRSRCQKITLKMGDKGAAVTWLAQHFAEPEQALLEAGGGPLAALRQLEDDYQEARRLMAAAWTDLFLHKGSVGRIADSLSKLDSRDCLATFSKWCVLASKQSRQVPVSANPIVTLAIAETRDRLGFEQWFTLHDRLLQLHRSDSASFKTQTVLEGLFADIRLMISG